MTTSTVIRPHTISLNGVRMPIRGKVRRFLASVYPEKLITGDVSRETHPNTSVLSLTSWPGGIGLEKLEGRENTKKAWWSTSATRHKVLTLPALTTQTADQGVSGTYVTIFGEYYEGGETTLYAAFGTTVKKYNNGTDLWGAGLKTLPAAATDSVMLRLSGTLYLVFATTSGFTTYDGSNWIDYIQDTKYLAHFPNATDTNGLWGIQEDGTLWAMADLGQQTANSGTVSAVETNGSAAVDDTGAVFTSTIRNGAHWIRITDAGGNALTGYIAVTDVDADDTRVNIFSEPARTTQNWIEGGATAFNPATALTFQVYKEATAKAQLPLPDGFVTDLFPTWTPSNTMVLHAMTKNALWSYDQTNDRWLQTELTIPNHPTAGIGSTRWLEDLFIPAGNAIYQYHTGADTIFVRSMGPDREDGLPQLHRGDIKKLASSQNDLLALIDGNTLSVALSAGAATYRHHLLGDGSSGAAFPGLMAMVAESSTQEGNATLLGWNREFWETKWVASTSGLVADDLVVNNAYGQYRAWWDFNGRVYYLDLPTAILNPSQIDTHEFATSSTHEYPWFDGDDEENIKVGLRYVGTAEGMSADETVAIKYILDYGTTEVTVGTVSANGRFAFDLPSTATPEGVEFRAIRTILDLSRGTNDRQQSPKIRTLDLVYRKKLTVKWGFEVTVDTGGDAATTPLAIRQAIATAVGTDTLVKFNYRDEDQQESAFWVDVRMPSSMEESGTDHKADMTLLLIQG